MNYLKQQISDRLAQALTQANSTLCMEVVRKIEQRDFHGFLSADEVAELSLRYQLNPVELALQLLPLSACYAHPPISEFYVGAVAIGASGNFYFGANQEFSQTNMAQTIHAEQSAIAHAWLHDERQIQHMIVNYTPCGHCRQFMNELRGAEELQIHLPHRQNNSLAQYLPDSFGPQDLQIERLLLDREEHQLKCDSQDPLQQSALRAANQCHAPYSQSYVGVALQMQDQQIISGRYAENAAFNPSLPALQVALNQAFLQGYELAHIQQICMLEKMGKLSYQQSYKDFACACLPWAKMRYVAL